MSNTMNITLPASIKKWVEKEAARKGFDTNTFFVELLQVARKSDSRDHVEQLLQEGLNSGAPAPVTATTWERIRSNGKKLAKELRKK